MNSLAARIKKIIYKHTYFENGQEKLTENGKRKIAALYENPDLSKTPARVYREEKVSTVSVPRVRPRKRSP